MPNPILIDGGEIFVLKMLKLNYRYTFKESVGVFYINGFFYMVPQNTYIACSQKVYKIIFVSLCI